jgi:predicted nucleotidyltransferase component of viral defense system
MAFNDQYRRQATLLIRSIPLVAEETCFALKGGTAINLFVRDMPRLSVDIDLTYLHIHNRATSLGEIDASMQRIGDRIGKAIRGARVKSAQVGGEDAINKHFIQADGVQVKIEVTPVLRGCVYEPARRATSPRVEEHFGFAEIQVVSFADLYAGKLVAALDRQHPRDLFDVNLLLANEGIDDALRKAFIVYLLGHNRPTSEVLAPARRDIAREYERGFDGMTETPMPLDELHATREEMIAQLVNGMPDEHRRFLVSFEEGKPDWGLLELPGAETLPAVQWRLQNLARTGTKKRGQLVDNLHRALELGRKASG